MLNVDYLYLLPSAPGYKESVQNDAMPHARRPITAFKNLKIAKKFVAL
jgi:hypothetical protein